jgi:hypothetical protein
MGAICVESLTHYFASRLTPSQYYYFNNLSLIDSVTQMTRIESGFDDNYCSHDVRAFCSII